MEVDPSGKVVDHQIAETLINVDHRMTYTSVAKILDGDMEERNKYEDFVEMFELMKELSDILRHRRHERGSIDFDFPESKIILDEKGRPVDVYPQVRNAATKIIEDFMAGVTVIIVKDDMLGKAPRELPTMLDYRTHVEKGSMFNTPPVVPIYTLMENLRWLKANGGVEAADKRAHERAEVLYAEIDRNKLFKGTVEETSRSLMNICFVMNDEYKELEKPFLDFATERGMVGIKGHRSVGGFRASCYNAQTMEGVQALVKAMQDFEAQH